MALEDIAWVIEPSGATEEALRAVEEQYGVSLPADYREFAKKFGGGVPSSLTDFEFTDAGGKHFEAVVGVFLAFDPSNRYDVTRTSGLLSDRIPRTMIPVVEDPGGDFIFLDYRTKSPPCVTYWRHDRSGFPNEFTIISDTFTGFLNMLHDPDPDE